MFTHRQLTESDAEAIADFPRSVEELFYLFPRAEYPLKPEVLIRESQCRLFPTVVFKNSVVAGYGNLMNVEKGSHCSIGNVIVNPAVRNQGVATYLVNLLSQQATESLNVREIRISCFNQNSVGLILYHKLGFVPFDMEERTNFNGDIVSLIHMRKVAI